jgi:hypothetical protein
VLKFLFYYTISLLKCWITIWDLNFLYHFTVIYKQSKLLQYLYFNREKTHIKYELKNITKHLKCNIHTVYNYTVNNIFLQTFFYI